MKLTACLIVRDEEQYLDACLSNISGVVDNIIVVDTGSTDNSREIAHAHGALVIDEPWCDDFSHARNLALEHASGDWILYIDADEMLHAEAGDLDCLDEAGAVVATVTFRAAAHLTTYREHRLFRNRPDIRFRSVIHETIMPDIKAILARGNAHIVHSGFRIEHLGYEGDLGPKHRRNHAMLLRAVQENPDRIYLWHALGECEFGLGNSVGASDAWRRALGLVRANPGKSENALIYADLMVLHFSANGLPLPDIAELVQEADQLHSADPLLLWWGARYLLSVAEPDAARARLQLLLDKNQGDYEYWPLAYDRRIFGSYSQALLGSCAAAEDNWIAAVTYWEQALQGDLGNFELKVKLDLARAKVTGQTPILGS